MPSDDSILRSQPREKYGGAEGIRTLDPHVANVVLSQLSYSPKTVYLLVNQIICFAVNVLDTISANLL